jgi:hypothetical protein
MTSFNKCRVSIFLALIVLSHFASASFQKSIWPKWGVSNPLSQEVISHHEWQDFLNHAVITNEEGINLVDYGNLKESDLELLDNYINRMSQINISNYNRNEQLAFWINLYNALIVKTVADYYPINSVQEINISPGLFSLGPWGAPLIVIKGTKLTLDEIHDRIIRAIWNDPRTHYAINEATIGSANLSKQAYNGITIESQLNEAAMNYVNSLRGSQIIEGKLVVSKIYDWYLNDFGSNEKDLIKHLMQFTKDPETRKQLSELKGVNTYVYNWHINSTISQG